MTPIDSDSLITQNNPHLRFRFLAFFGFSVLALTCTLYVYVSKTNSVDDAFIIYRVAQNLSNGVGMLFNHYDEHLAVTTPLFTLLLSLLHKITAIQVDLIAEYLSLISLFIASIFLYLVTKRYDKTIAFFAPVIIFFNVEVIDHLGNEIPLLMALVLGFVYFQFCRRRLYISFLFLSLACLTRIDSALLGVLVFIVEAKTIREYVFDNKDYAGFFKEYGYPFCVFLFPLAIWHLYSFVEFGNIFPSTLDVKTAQGKSGLWTLFQSDVFHHFRKSLRYSDSLTFFVAVSTVCLLLTDSKNKSFRLVFVWLLLYLVIYSSLGVPNYGWYYWPIYLFSGLSLLFVFGCIDTRLNVEFAPGHRAGPWSMSIQPYVLSTLKIAFCFCLLSVYTGDVDRQSFFKYILENNNQQTPKHESYLEIGNYLNERCLTGNGNLVASDEIGIIGYTAMKCSFIDMPGILMAEPSPELVGRFTATAPSENGTYTTSQQPKITQFILKYSPDYLVLRERTYPPAVLVYDEVEESGLAYQQIYKYEGNYLVSVYQRSSVPENNL